MELCQFYLDNVKADEYYYIFYDKINNARVDHYNVFIGKTGSTEFKFDIIDDEDAIEQFKGLCQPEVEGYDFELECKFYAILFYLYKRGYVLNQFPRVIERPPKSRYDFVYHEIRNKIIANGDDFNGTVRYATRRVFISQFIFTQRNPHIELSSGVAQKIRQISNRDASFESMSIDEKLAEIDNAIESLLKDGKNFLQLDYTSICFDFIDDQKIRDYRKKLQCFRHAHDAAIAERATFTDDQKNFLIDFGITVLKVIESKKAELGI